MIESMLSHFLAKKLFTHDSYYYASVYLLLAEKHYSSLTIRDDAPSVLWCCWLGLLTCKTHYRVREPTAAWQFDDICRHRSFDGGWQYVSCGQRQPPSSGAPVNKGLSTITRERQIPPDLESGGFPHLFWVFLSPHIGSGWRARHDNNNNKTLNRHH